MRIYPAPINLLVHAEEQHTAFASFAPRFHQGVLGCAHPQGDHTTALAYDTLESPGRRQRLD